MRTAVVVAFGAIIAALSMALVVMYPALAALVPYEFASPVIDYIGMGISVILACVVIGFGVKYHNAFAVVLAAIQVAGSLAFEFGIAQGIEVEQGLYIDSLSIVMALIIGIIGSGICVYALGYMRDFQAHQPKGTPDRRPTFFALMFLFLSAMYVIVFSNNMVWMFTGWEVTTVCSFLLIAYTRTEEAIANAFRQIVMNLLGGIGFLAGLFFVAINCNTLSFIGFIQTGLAQPALAMFPACALAFAGITKAAQMPFHTWLLGAMVAPTPTSALLHSSTMVKAGVFLLIRLAPLFTVCIYPAVMVILVGGVTFMLCSFMAISQTNAKRVLAYSTIANLGLIVACAGVATPEAIWAAILLVIFHAAAKSLLFLCVGTVEHHIGSRDIEDMDLLFDRMPRLARFMMLGIMCMFIAPFGMLVAKWATIVTFAETGNYVLILLLAFGSAATFMFWGKWLGKLTGIAGSPENVELTVHPTEWFSLLLMVFLSVGACISLPMLSHWLVEPYVIGIFGTVGQAIETDNLMLAGIMAVFAVAVLCLGPGRSKAQKADVYLSGVSRDSDTRTFANSLGGSTHASARNLYLDGLFGEGRIRRFGEVACGTIQVAAIVASLFFVGIVL